MREPTCSHPMPLALQVMGPFSAAAMESYSRAYPHLVKLHMLQEVADTAGGAFSGGNLLCQSPGRGSSDWVQTGCPWPWAACGSAGIAVCSVHLPACLPRPGAGALPLVELCALKLRDGAEA